MKVLLHVNYWEKPGDGPEKLFALAKRAGCDGVELRWKYKFTDRTQAEYQALAAELKQRYPEMQIVFGGNVDFCRDANGSMKQDLADYCTFLEWAHQYCGTTLMNFFTGQIPGADWGKGIYHTGGSGGADASDYERAAEGLRTVGDAAQALGVKIALEMHNGYLHDLAKPCAKLMSMTDHPAIGLNYDHGNVILNQNGESIDDVFKTLPGKIYYAHLKNMLVMRVPDVCCKYAVTRLDSGMINQYRVMELLKTELQGDAIAIEYPCPGDGITAALKDMEYIRFLKSELDIQ